MGQRHTELSDKLKKFVEEQKIFFVGTAAADGKVNISPKGMDSLKVLGKNRIVWLNVTGSGNETSAHVQENSRMTLMFAALEGKPVILRLYGDAKVIHNTDPEWEELFAMFDSLPGARQIFDLSISLVQTSCGMAVPFFDYVGEREQLNDWATKKGDQGIREYWNDKNQISLDGKPTHIMEKNV
ncbi:MAG: pyridoxamine 5'-phosphate oxidase family protein [Gammaproteobacteria bacterium]|nr:MAG: pyridoxamine 5'-phosphate oxidase family protein [Gammaproteobacteria bacterium]